MRLVNNGNTDADSALSVSLDSQTSSSLPGPSSAMNGATSPTTPTISNGHSSLSTNGLANGNAARKAQAAQALLAVRDGESLHNNPEASSSRSITRVALPGSKLYHNSAIDREEFVRLVLQTLRDVGYAESAATLEAESGYRMETPDVSHFRDCILSASWSEAEVYLSRLGVEDEESLRLARFLISQQKYLELLEAQSVNAALHVLRNELAPLNSDVDELHSLSGLIMCSSAQDLKQRAKWDGAAGSSRTQLLTSLQRLIPPSTMLPQRRFAEVIGQAFAHQRMNCLYHNAPFTPEAFSLLTDHHCPRSAFPLVTTTVLKQHTDEVWNIRWSSSGQYLATASKDHAALIWKIDFEREHEERDCLLVKEFREHQNPVGCLAWSLDDSIILTSAEATIKMWNVKSGLCLWEMKEQHEETVSALEWLPDGSGFISGGLDRKIIVWDSSRKLHELWLKTSVRVTDLAIAPDMSRLVVVGLETLPLSPAKSPSSTSVANATDQAANVVSNAARSTKENRIIIYNFSTKREEASIRLDGELTSVKISQDSRYALVNHAPDEVQLWDLETGRLARKFTGQRQGQHVIRSCFGGADGNFIVSGSEDGNVYVWHRDTGIPLEVLPGHGEGSVNAVAWNPMNERMFASCSDDRTVRIWECPHASLLEQQTLGGHHHVSSIDSHGSGLANALLGVDQQNGKGKGKATSTVSLGRYGAIGTGSGSSSMTGLSISEGVE